ncbi:MAG TPA: sigma-54 dependent transcriptional regulator [bacterium]|nr:sigma-54 dependent transcriptional regulator [bacterium]
MVKKRTDSKKADRPAPASSRAAILVVDDHRAAAEGLAELLRADGYETYVAFDVVSGLAILEDEAVDVVIADLVIPGMDGLDFLMAVRERWPALPFVILTGYGTIESAVEATRRGAYEYLTKPIDPERLARVVEKALERRKLELENIDLRTRLYEKHSFDRLIGRSKPMQEIYDLVARIAPTNATVLIYGESGTGKELIADSIHYNSRRRDKSLVKLNCAALAEGVLESELFGHEKGAFTGAVRRHRGRFEQADGGTLFLDEVSQIPPATQVTLLRVLEDGVFRRVGGGEDMRADVRVIAATNVGLEGAVAAGKFREDLYYRLKVVTIDVPLLRERAEDIPLLVNAFIREFNEKNHLDIEGVDDDVIWLFRAYGWPGNVRELRNVVESMAVMARTNRLTREDIPPNVRRSVEEVKADGVRVGMKLADAERYLIEATLKELGGNRTRAAKVLGIGLRTLQRKLKSYGVN